jgi:hypothetical protein
MQPYATSVCDLKLLVYATLSYYLMAHHPPPPNPILSPSGVKLSVLFSMSRIHPPPHPPANDTLDPTHSALFRVTGERGRDTTSARLSVAVTGPHSLWVKRRHA